MKLFQLIILSCMIVLVSACQAGLSIKPEQNSEFINVAGKLYYKQKIALPIGAKIVIRLEEQGIMDIAAALIAQTQIITTGQQVPIEFNLNVPKHILNKAHMPGFSVFIYRQQKLIFTNDRAMPYQPNATQMIELVAVH